MREAQGRVLLLTGPPGAGKTTVSRALASRIEPGAHVETDRFFHIIAAGYIEPWRPEAHRQNALVVRIVADAAESYAKAGYATIVEGILTPGWFLEPVRDALTAAGIEVSVAILRPSLDTAVRRRSGSDASPVPREIIEQLWKGFANLGPLESHVIDNEAHDIETTIDQLTDRWEGEQLRV